MKITLQPVALIAFCVASLGLASFSGGCAATSTQQSTGEYVDDSSITLKVKAAFVKDPVVKVFSVNVDTFKGVVQLSGFVDTADAKAQAGRVAANIAGVSEVKNAIVVK